MIDHYNAFISYRHVPRDITVAEEVQRQLERFRIPAAIRKSTGISKIERIFRDKDELPISANLTDDIDYALKHSDFLIVICSPAVLESVWVAREIDLFLETHSEQQVLTVLSEGDPSQAIPPRLLQRRETVTLEDGSRQEVMVPTEPLSCDYRMSFRDARKKELPRLAAVMLGCSYDELVNRTRQYQTRRIAALATVLFAAGAAALTWLLYSNARIRENLRQAYINQSHYLASESVKAYDDQDRILAAQLALAALPKEGEERPVIAEAEYALGISVGAFTTPGSTDFRAVRRYDNSGVRISDFTVSPDRNYIVQTDVDHKLTMIDIATGEVLAVKQFSGTPELLEARAEGVLIDMTNYTAVLDWETAEPVWENTLEHFTWNLTLAEDMDQYAVCTQDKIYIIDRGTGKQIREMTMPEAPQDYRREKVMLYSGDKTAMIFRDDTSIMSQKQILYLAEDPMSGSFVRQAQEFSDILHICENSAGDTVITDRVMGEDETSGLNDMWFLYESRIRTRCFDRQTGAERWQILVPYTLYGYQDVRRQVYTDQDGVSHNGLICTEANVQAVIDIDAGILQKRTEWPAEVINIYSTSEEMFSSLLEDGSISMLYFDRELSASRKTFTDELIQGSLCSSRERGEAGMIVLQERKDYLVKYLMGDYDHDYRELPDLAPGIVKASKIAGDTAVFLGSDLNAENAAVTVYDLVNEKTLYTYPIADRGYYSLDNLQLTEDMTHAYVYDYRYSHADIRVFGLQAEEQEVITLPKDMEKTINVSYDRCGDTVRYLGNIEDHWVYGCWRYGEEITEQDLGEAFLHLNQIKVSPDGKKILAVGETADASEIKLFLLNTENGENRELMTVQNPSSLWFAWAEDGGMFAVSSEQDIRIFDGNGEQTALIETDTEHLCDMEFMDGSLFTVYNDSRLVRRSLSGEIERQYDIWLYTGMKKQEFNWIREGDALYIGASGLINILHTDQNQSGLYIPNELLLDFARRRVLVYTPAEYAMGGVYTVGTFPLYTTEELIAKGQAIVEGTSLSDKQKQTYGLE